MIGMVWAQATGGVIGRDGTVPWHVPEDMAHFRAITWGSTVVMGRATWDSLPARWQPLPGRRNVVLTRQQGWTADGALVVHDVDGALAAAGPDADVWVMGGAQVYAAALPHADVLEVTDLDLGLGHRDGDALAPSLGPEWATTARDPDDGGWHASSTGVRYRYRTLHRTLRRQEPPPARG